LWARCSLLPSLLVLQFLALQFQVLLKQARQDPQRPLVQPLALLSGQPSQTALR
jgi:hypothetical protein